MPFESAFAKASDSTKATPDRTADKIGFDWVCFGFDWVRIGFVLGLYWVCIGFVFTQFAIGNIFIILC